MDSFLWLVYDSSNYKPSARSLLPHSTVLVDIFSFHHFRHFSSVSSLFVFSSLYALSKVYNLYFFYLPLFFICLFFHTKITNSLHGNQTTPLSKISFHNPLIVRFPDWANHSTRVALNIASSALYPVWRGKQCRTDNTICGSN